MSLEVWQYPEVHHAYVMGVDTAEGLGHGDYSVIQVLDVGTGEQCAIGTATLPLTCLPKRCMRSGCGTETLCAA